MPKETVLIDTGWKPDHYGAAIYLSILAYPDKPEKRKKFLYAVKAWIIKDMHDGRLPTEKIRSSEILGFSKTRDIENQFHQVFKKIYKDRLDAFGKSLYLILSGGKYRNSGIVKLSNSKTFSITEAYQMQFPPKEKAQESGNENMHCGLYNAMNRIWRPSKKVVHLMYGLQHTKGIPGDSEAIKWLIGDPDWIEEAIIEAEKIRLSIIEHEFLKKYEENSIQIIYQK